MRVHHLQAAEQFTDARKQPGARHQQPFALGAPRGAERAHRQEEHGAGAGHHRRQRRRHDDRHDARRRNGRRQRRRLHQQQQRAVHVVNLRPDGVHQRGRSFTGEPGPRHLHHGRKQALAKPPHHAGLEPRVPVREQPLQSGARRHQYHHGGEHARQVGHDAQRAQQRLHALRNSVGGPVAQRHAHQAQHRNQHQQSHALGEHERQRRHRHHQQRRSMAAPERRDEGTQRAGHARRPRACWSSRHARSGYASGNSASGSRATLRS